MNRSSNGAEFKPFDATLQDIRLFPLTATGIEVMQLNFGRLCNQSCQHCHVEAGPERKEMISRESLEQCLEILSKTSIPTVDITGGTPELNPHFRWFVREVRKLNKQTMVRCNLTILLEPGQEDLHQFYADQEVKIIASMPCYLRKNVDAQRGKGIFDKSIKALKRLNSVQYGVQGSGLILNLVYNPGGAFLPPSQTALEIDYKRELSQQYGVSFNHVLTIINMPVGRFLRSLKDSGDYHGYIHRLINAFNPEAAAGVMCRYTLSVGWDGSLYDCDFNLVLEMNCNHGAPTHLNEFNLKTLENRQIVTGLHCYGCTAGAGSSCGGAVVE
jgi:radical SAM/Cys-rich protein